MPLGQIISFISYTLPSPALVFTAERQDWSRRCGFSVVKPSGQRFDSDMQFSTPGSGELGREGDAYVLLRTCYSKEAAGVTPARRRQNHTQSTTSATNAPVVSSSES